MKRGEFQHSFALDIFFLRFYTSKNIPNNIRPSSNIQGIIKPTKESIEKGKCKVCNNTEPKKHK